MLQRLIGGLPRRDLLAGSAAAASVLAAPALAATQSRVLRYRATLDLVTLDPIATISTPTFEAAFLIYDCLFGFDDSLTPQPQMIDRFETEDNGLTWRFALREGLWFHDGERVRAQDAVASLARWASRDRVGRVLHMQVTEMRALDDRTFEIRLARPFPRMLTSLATPTLVVMPERVATRTDAATSVKDHTGSGPFVFQADEWVSGARAVFRRNLRYQPRQQQPSLLSGGKSAQVDRVEWTTMPDSATAVAALQNDEIDLIHVLSSDFVPLLRMNKHVVVDRLNQFGNTAVLVFNTIIPPFDNPALRRALLLAVNQEDCMRAVAGDQSDLMRTGVGVFAPASPFATAVGMEVLTGPRDMELVRRLVRESGYRGELVALMVPTDTPNLLAFGNVIYQTLKNCGVNIEYQAVDWGTLVSRRSQVKTGGWHCHISVNPGQDSMPSTHYFLSSAYYQDVEMNALRDAWYDAPDRPAEQRAAEQIQRRFFENPPVLPLGQFYPASAYRTGLSGLVRAPWALFWGVEKA